MHLHTCLAALAASVAGTAPAHATPGPTSCTRATLAPPRDDSGAVVLRAKRVIVRPGKVLEDATVLVENGVIVEVGAGIEAPEGATVIEGEVVCAGFLDPWSTLGVTSGAQGDSRTDAATRTVDAFDPFANEHARDEALRAGVVAARVQAGDGASVSGIGALVSLGPGTSRNALVVVEEANVGAAIGASERGRPADVFDRIGQVDKLAGEIKSGADYRTDHVEYRHEIEAWEAEIAKAAEKLEKDFKKAQKARDKDVEEAEEKGKEFKEKKYKEDKKPKAPKFDADKEVMARVAEGELPLIVHLNRAAELREFLAATREFERLRLVLAGCTEALTVADELAQRRIPVIVWPAPLGSGSPDEYDGHDLSLAAQLEEKGVTVLLGSAGGASRDLPLLASLAIGHGLDREDAFAALTLRAARVLDVADRYGSVQRGRRADLLVLDGEPLLPTTRVRHVLVGGRVVVSPER